MGEGEVQAMTVRLQDISTDFGTLVEGLELHEDLDDETCRTLRRTFDERGVLVLRDIDITADEQKYLAGILTTAAAPERSVMEAAAHLYPTNISNRDEDGNAPFGSLLYHSDMMWSATPMQLLSLYGLDVEQPSIPTIFASTTHAWDTLPEDLRARVEGRQALHITGQQQRGENQDQLLKPIRDTDEFTITPVGHRHPRTGRTMLYVSQMMTREIVGLPHEESEELLEALFAHLYSPANTWPHEWRSGDLVLWDNLSVQHGRPSVTLEGPARTLRKVIAPSAVSKSVRGTAETPRFQRAG
jgi:alpha-ketoglutarate-dependent taurine dioxygenase